MKHNDVLMTAESRKTGFYGFWMKIGKLSNFRQKNLGICDFDEVFELIQKGNDYCNIHRKFQVKKGRGMAQCNPPHTFLYIGEICQENVLKNDGILH